MRHHLSLTGRHIHSSRISSRYHSSASVGPAVSCASHTWALTVSANKAHVVNGKSRQPVAPGQRSAAAVSKRAWRTVRAPMVIRWIARWPVGTSCPRLRAPHARAQASMYWTSVRRAVSWNSRYRASTSGSPKVRTRSRPQPRRAGSVPPGSSADDMAADGTSSCGD